jgi:hypothetical protein
MNAAVGVILGVVALGVSEALGWPHEVGIFGAIFGAALGGLLALRAAIMRRLDALEAEAKRRDG